MLVTIFDSSCDHFASFFFLVYDMENYLRLCGPVDDESSNGIVSYIAPKVLCENKNIKESDVYIIGMLMWDIFSGYLPFDNRTHYYQLHIITSFALCFLSLLLLL